VQSCSYEEFHSTYIVRLYTYIVRGYGDTSHYIPTIAVFLLKCGGCFSLLHTARYVGVLHRCYVYTLSLTADSCARSGVLDFVGLVGAEQLLPRAHVVVEESVAVSSRCQLEFD